MWTDTVIDGSANHLARPNMQNLIGNTEACPISDTACCKRSCWAVRLSKHVHVRSSSFDEMQGAVILNFKRAEM